VKGPETKQFKITSVRAVEMNGNGRTSTYKVVRIKGPIPLELDQKSVIDLVENSSFP